MGEREKHRRVEELMRAKRARCTCGWPAETGEPDHAQDCDIEEAWDDAIAQAEDEAEEAELGPLIAALEADYRQREATS